jgi:hypothetical protein
MKCELLNIEFVQNLVDPFLYIYKQGGTILLLYIDNIFAASRDVVQIE